MKTPAIYAYAGVVSCHRSDRSLYLGLPGKIPAPLRCSWDESLEQVLHQ